MSSSNAMRLVAGHQTNSRVRREGPRTHIRSCGIQPALQNLITDVPLIKLLAHQKRMSNGFKLFGKYFEALWD